MVDREKGSRGSDKGRERERGGTVTGTVRGGGGGEDQTVNINFLKLNFKRNPWIFTCKYQKNCLRRSNQVLIINIFPIVIVWYTHYVCTFAIIQEGGTRFCTEDPVIPITIPL